MYGTQLQSSQASYRFIEISMTTQVTIGCALAVRETRCCYIKVSNLGADGFVAKSI